MSFARTYTNFDPFNRSALGERYSGRIVQVGNTGTPTWDIVDGWLHGKQSNASYEAGSYGLDFKATPTPQPSVLAWVMATKLWIANGAAKLYAFDVGTNTIPPTGTGRTWIEVIEDGTINFGHGSATFTAYTRSPAPTSEDDAVLIYAILDNATDSVTFYVDGVQRETETGALVNAGGTNYEIVTAVVPHSGLSEAYFDFVYSGPAVLTFGAPKWSISTM